MSEQSASSARPLVVEGLTAHYGPAQALWGISLTVGPGEVLALLGENGAGKTTLLRSLARVHRQATGTIRYGDTDLMKVSADRVARQGISMVRDGARVFESLTIEEHIYLALRLERSKTGRSSTVDDVLAKFPVLARRGRGVKAGYLSGGQRQALCLAMAVGAGASFLLLDEPSAGLAESTAEETFSLIASLAQQGVSMLIAEQQPRWLSGWTTATVRLEMGRVASLTRT
jgi:ABC-type branched-subunit amino acid transport system ATPase component